MKKLLLILALFSAGASANNSASCGYYLRLLDSGVGIYEEFAGVVMVEAVEHYAGKQYQQYVDMLNRENNRGLLFLVKKCREHPTAALDSIMSLALPIMKQTYNEKDRI